MKILFNLLTKTLCILSISLICTINSLAQAKVQPFGFAVAGGEFNNPGFFPTDAEMDYYQSTGLKLIRLPISWENFQPTLGGPLDVNELQHLKTVLNQAQSRNMSVLIDLHNYCRRTFTINGKTELVPIGTSTSTGIAVTVNNLTDFWTRIATEVKDQNNVWAYGLMNEPHNMDETPISWFTMAQACITEIRKIDTKTMIDVAGDSWSSANGWVAASDDLKNLIDPNNNLIYEAHCYFDDGSSLTYSSAQSQLNKKDPNIGIERVKPFVDWLHANNLRGFVGEFGVPADSDWLIVLDNFVKYLSDNCVSGTYWAAGAAWGKDYDLLLEPNNGVEKPQMAILKKYLYPTGCTITPKGPFTGTPINIAGTIEAENYDTGGEGVSYHDTEAANLGGTYRTDGVDIGAITTGGNFVGWTAIGEWLEYTVNVNKTSSYDFKFVTASPSGTGQIGINVDGTVLFTGLTTPTTTDFNTYTSFTKSASLSQGQHVIRVLIQNSGFNLDKIIVTQSVEPKGPYSGNPINIAGTIEAENYDTGGEAVSYHDTDVTNLGGTYRTDGVDIGAIPAGGNFVGWTATGEWLEYTVNVTKTTLYDFNFITASPSGTGQIGMNVDGASLFTGLITPTTADFNTYTSFIATASLTQGQHIIRILIQNSGFNIDKVIVTETICTATISSPSSSFCAGGSVLLTASAGASYKWFNGATQVGTAATYSATIAGSYTVEVTNVSGCKITSAPKVIIQNALPVIVHHVNVNGTWLNANQASICSGSAVIIGPWPAKANGWNWTGPNNFTSNIREISLQNTTTNQAGAYTGVYVDSNGCSASSTFILNVGSAGIAAITSPANSFCAGSSVLLTASAGNSYKWFNGATQVGTASTFSAIAAGSYTVQVSNASGCSSTSVPKVITVTSTITWYQDTDGDGKGDASKTLLACIQPAGYVAIAGDACPTDANKFTPGNCGCNKTETSCLDCAGIANGSAITDACGKCAGGTTGVAIISDPSKCNITTGITEIQGVKCVNTGTNNAYTLNAGSLNVVSVNWWSNSAASITIDARNSKNMSINFPANTNGSNIIITAGVNINAAPWYKEFTFLVKVGGCNGNNAAPQLRAMASPQPFNTNTTVALENNEIIQNIKIVDMNGIEIFNATNVNASSFELGNDFKTGVYIAYITSNNGTSIIKLVKSN
jgi:aryl-phospho-beta-D-glucosidase BglC (GH1 family)